MESFDFDSYRQQTTRVLAKSVAAAGSFVPVLEELQLLAGEAEQLLERQPGGDPGYIACGPGCCDCCVVNVATLIPEGIAIVHFLQQLDASLTKRLAVSLDCLWREVRGLDEEERLYLRRKCAFLNDQGQCLIYPVRPLLCRSVTSTSPEKCREALDSQIFGETTAILMHQLQQEIYDTLFTGIAAGLEQAGLDERSYQLSGLVRFLLRQPESEAELFAGRRLTWQDLY